MEYELIPQFDSRKSFHKKAMVKTEDNKKILYSYKTKVCIIDLDTNTAQIISLFSDTTTRHIKEFLLQNNFKVEDTNQLKKDYITKYEILESLK